MTVMDHYVKKALTFLKKADVTISGAWIDCGCGNGTYARALIVLGATPVIAVDVSLSRISRIGPPVLKCAGNCGHLPFKEKEFSGFLYINVLHYYERPAFLIGEAYRVLQPGGYLLIIEYQQRTPVLWDPYPLSFDDLKMLLYRKFSIHKTVLVDTHYRPKQLIVGVRQAG